MFMLRARVLASGMALVLLCGCSASEREPNPAAVPEPAAGPDLQRASIEWDSLFNAGDAQSLAARYAEDAVSMPPNLPTLRGREALRADFEQFMAHHHARHQTRVESITREGDLAVERAEYRLTFRPKAGGPEVVEDGRHIQCRQRIGGQWLIVSEIWNALPPSANTNP